MAPLIRLELAVVQAVFNRHPDVQILAHTGIDYCPYKDIAFQKFPM